MFLSVVSMFLSTALFNERDLLHFCCSGQLLSFQAYLAMVQAMEWKEFLVLYEDNEGLVSIKLPCISYDDNIDILLVSEEAIISQ